MPRRCSMSREDSKLVPTVNSGTSPVAHDEHRDATYTVDPEMVTRYHDARQREQWIDQQRESYPSPSREGKHREYTPCCPADM